MGVNVGMNKTYMWEVYRGQFTECFPSVNCTSSSRRKYGKGWKLIENFPW